VKRADKLCREIGTVQMMLLVTRQFSSSALFGFLISTLRC